MSYRIALVGGGSGGHVYPLLAVAQELKNIALSQGVDLKIQMWGDGQIFKSSSGGSGIPYRNILGAKWRRYFSIWNFLDLFKIPVGILQSLFYIWLFMPDVIFAKGGYASVLPVIVARLFMIPVFIHESDAVPGKANVLLSKLAKKIFISFQSSQNYFPKEKTELTGNPIRPPSLNISKDKALQLFELSENKPTIFIMGGSQGARAINNFVVSGLLELIKNFQIIHQTGPLNFNSIKKEIEKLIEEKEKYHPETAEMIKKNYKFYPFFDFSQMEYAYAASDIIISRAGSGALFEIAFAGKPAIIIPILNSASNHQLANSQEFAAFGSIVIEEPNLTIHILIDQIKKAYNRKEELGAKIKQFSKPEAAKIIANKVVEFLV